MKKILLLFACVFCQISFGQTTKIIQGNEVHTVNLPLIVANGNETYNNCSSFNVNNLESINVYKGEKAISLYGEKAKNGVLEITFKPNIILLKLLDFYKKYQISVENQNLPIFLNKHFLDEKKHLLLDESAIISVQVLDEQPFVEPVLLPKGKAIYIETKEK